VAVESEYVPWSVAWQRAAFGPDGFYTSGPVTTLGPSAFFRTSVHVGAVVHRALARLLVEVDERLGHPERLDLVDVGAGRAELIAGMLAALPDEIGARVHAVAIDVRPAPSDLDPRITWVASPAPGSVPAHLRGLVVAHEWLDDIPLDVVALDDRRRPRLVLVDGTGDELLGPRLDDDEAWAAWGLDAGAARAWIDQWWSFEGREPAERIEIGQPRDDAWQSVVSRLELGVALAIDYGHLRTARPYRGTLVAHSRDGRAQPPTPSPELNLTAHVAVDSLATAVGARVAHQRDALAALGVSSFLPDGDRAADPAAYADALSAASDAAELLDPVGLGAFHWIRVDR
jgi:SAM-dependent MidA family methyltransferase